LPADGRKLIGGLNFMEGKMINIPYLVSELTFRKRRSLINMLVVATAMGILVYFGLLAVALQRAFLTPLTDIGASMIVQVSGDVPEQMAGPVLPCSVAPIGNEQIVRIRNLAGVQSLSEAVLFWDFESKVMRIVVGFNPLDPAGPALLRNALVSGRYLTGDDTGKALADLSWAQAEKAAPGTQVRIAGRTFTIAGIVDSSRIGRIATAQLYIPLKDAKAIASGSASINAVHPFRADDANLLFIKAQRDETEAIAAETKGIIGEKATVTTPDSFKETLGSLLAVTDRFAGLISGLCVIAALLLVARTAASGIRERTMEIGVMKAIGWSGSDIILQLAMESFTLILIGTIVGIGIGLLGSWLTSFMSLSIPIPWEMAPSPHFQQGGAAQFSREVRLAMVSPLKILPTALLSSLLIGLVTGVTALRAINRLKPSEVFRND
jgi:ABC-type antimicrobial peptide transport system permease subunit